MSASPTILHTGTSSSYGTIKPTHRPPSLRGLTDDDPFDETPSSDSPGTLHRGLTSRQVQMIAIGGTIGTGLFLGTGRSLAQGGPARMLICYSTVGFIVYVTLLLLGEMATQYPIAGECFNVVSRFGNLEVSFWLFLSFLVDTLLRVLTSSSILRIFQCLYNKVFLPCLWIRPLVELLVQRCYLCRHRSYCCSIGVGFLGRS